MSPKSISLFILVPIFAIFAPKLLIILNSNTRFFTYLIHFCLPSSSSSIAIFGTIVYKRHHKTSSEKAKMVPVCDDFPVGIPPAETNTTLTLCVDPNGCCNFTTVQAAIEAVPNFSPKRTVLWINSGVYYEKVTVPRNKPNVTFQGQGYTSTTIAWNDTAASANGTFYSGSVQVFASNFIAKNISFMNVARIANPGDVGAQAVAIRIAGDQAAFWGCGFFGAQDTLHDDRGRHYFKDCYVQGSIDFIFGDARSLYENCQLLSMASPVAPGSKAINGAITAHGRASKDENTGFSFVNCTIGGNGRIWLGRAWKPFSRVVFAICNMTNIIAPEGWNDFNDSTRDQTIFYGEYNCSGPGANLTMRATYVQRLNDTQASPYLNISFIDGDQWLQPYS
ncbi:hypothetical protein SLA2020_031090 [Shorea laevis]